jgi:hypothetical protein
MVRMKGVGLEAKETNRGVLVPRDEIRAVPNECV